MSGSALFGEQVHTLHLGLTTGKGLTTADVSSLHRASSALLALS